MIHNLSPFFDFAGTKAGTPVVPIENRREHVVRSTFSRYSRTKDEASSSAFSTFNGPSLGFMLNAIWHARLQSFSGCCPTSSRFPTNVLQNVSGGGDVLVSSQSASSFHSTVKTFFPSSSIFHRPDTFGVAL
ncbi:hypothetical protein TMatcc_008507 [Talaromyces marneffei ATCC 18224]